MICVNKKCASDIPEGARFCPWCGWKQKPDKRKRVRPNGHGTVYKLKNGKWRAEKTIGYKLIAPPEGSPPGTPPTKKRISVTKSGFRTKSEALAYLPHLTAAEKRERQHKVSDALTARKGEQITAKWCA